MEKKNSLQINTWRHHRDVVDWLGYFSVCLKYKI